VSGSPCLYYQQLPRSGTHYIEVTSANPDDSGAFTLRLLQPRDPNPPDSLDQRLGDSTTSVTPGDTINQTSLLLRAVLSDPDLVDSLHLEAEVRPVGQQFSGPNVPDGPTVGNGQAAWINVSGLSDNTSPCGACAWRQHRARWRVDRSSATRHSAWRYRIRPAPLRGSSVQTRWDADPGQHSR
jgi:hypothetical protein